MRRLTIFFSMLVATLAPSLLFPALAQDTSDRVAAIVLIERDPWLMVIGSDSPTFAFYSNGDVIYRTEKGYKESTLDKTQQIKFLHSINVEKLSVAAKHYDASQSTDQPTIILAIIGKAKPSIISVYGSLRSSEVREALPPEVSAAYDTLKTFSDPAARDWLPEKIEVIIWPYEYAPDKSIFWPKDWPGLSDAATVKRGEDTYSIYLPSTKYAELKIFLESRKEKGAVEIGGKKWAASVRFPFPDERKWMGH